LIAQQRLEKVSVPVADALNWLRNNNPDIDIDDFDDKSLSAIASLAGIPMPRGGPSKDGKGKAMEDSLDWIRQNSPSLEDVDLPTLAALATSLGCLRRTG
jgi:hypothetical protein